MNLSDLIVHVQLQAIYGPRLLRIEPVVQTVTKLLIQCEHDVVSPVFGSGVRLGNWVVHYLTLRELARWEKVFDRYRGRICLDCGPLLLFVGLFLLA